MGLGVSIHENHSHIHHDYWPPRDRLGKCHSTDWLLPHHFLLQPAPIAQLHSVLRPLKVLNSNLKDCSIRNAWL